MGQKAADRSNAQASGTNAPETRKRHPVAKDEAHLSQALRTAYQQTIEEDVPAEMLDLLSKLG